MKTIPFLLCLVLIACYQVMLRDVVTIWGATINVAALVVIFFAFTRSELVSLWYGFFAGLVAAAPEISNVGWHALIMALVGVGSFQVRDKLNIDSLYARLLLVFSGTLIHNIVSLLLNPSTRTLSDVAIAGFGGAVYTTLVALVVFKAHELFTRSAAALKSA